MYQFSTISMNRLRTCCDTIQKVMQEAIKKSPYDFGITHGHRTPEEQYELYQKGRTKPGNIVTYCDGYKRKSKHNYDPSLAVDIVAYNNKGITWESKYYIKIAEHVKNVSDDLYEKGEIDEQIVWGGDWHKFKDYPHFQV